MPVRIASQAEPIPGYKLIERLGRGGFGEVWKAEAPGGLLKAIKFVYGGLGDDKEGGGSQELRALNRVKTVRHPFILSLERVDIVEGQLVIVMELADRNLSDRLRECQQANLPGIPRDELLRYMEEAAEALDLMDSEYQLQHLDIKPQNLFLVRNHIKVADFGLVKDLEGMKASITGGVTPLYAAPETFEGWVSRYCDQYSLAIVYEELLTGQRPFSGTSARQLLKQHVEQDPDLSALPAADQTIIGRALAKKPSDRFPSCSYLVRMLRSADGSGETPSGHTAPAAPPISAPQTSVPPSVVVPRPEGTLTPQTSGPDTKPAQHALPTRDTDRVAVQPAAPVEFTGAGVLFPATVIGLGQVGVSVLQKLHEGLHEQFGSVDALANIRLLAMDIDPDSLSAAARSRQGGALSSREMMLVRLNRPGHFLKPRDGAVEYQAFMDPEMLYRITRNQQTGGLRCLGRLALVDNYREVADRLRGELGACTEAEALAAADRKTGLGLRNTIPRVYVIASLAGGTGSGMFIDVAYLARFFLKQLGHPQPDVVGLFFLPRTQQQPTRPFGVGNTYAALTELHHFSSPEATFSARYAPKEPPLTDAGAPFGRCVLMHLSREDKGNQSLAGLAAGLLFRDLVTPLGRTADARRATVLADAAQAPVLVTFGMNRLTWPRRALVQQIARRLCLRIAQHWTDKEAEPIQQAVETWAKEQWTNHELQPEKLIQALKASCAAALDGKAPEDVFETITAEFAKKVPPGGLPEPGAIRAAFAEFERIVGRPEGDRPPPKTPVLVESLEQAGKALLTACEQKLAEMAVHLVEQPKFRLVGAEEAIRNFNILLQESIQQQEPLCAEFVKKANETYARIVTLSEGLTAAARRKPGTLASDLAELLRLYPMLRLRALILQRVLTILRSLRGNCPEYLREFGFCRTRLLDMVKAFESPVESHAAVALGPERELFPAGCYKLEDTVAKFVNEVSSEELFELDQRVQTILKARFTALVHVCTTAANLLKDLEPAMQQEMEAFVADRLGATNAVETFLAQHAEEARANAELQAAHKEAAPRLALEPSAPSSEMALVIVPAVQAAPEFRRLLQAALPQAETAAGAKNDDVVFYRETPPLSFADLCQTGAEGRAAYQQMLAAAHLTPHSRTDVAEWRLPAEH
jgi:serine/threonine protein kinase